MTLCFKISNRKTRKWGRGDGQLVNHEDLSLNPKTDFEMPPIVAHANNPSTEEAETGTFSEAHCSTRLAWSVSPRSQ